MNSQRAIAASFWTTILSVALIVACNRGEESAVKGPNAPNGAKHDTLSDLTLNEDGLGQIQIGMNLDDTVSMGLLNENPNKNARCDFVFPAVGGGIPDGVSVMVVRGKVARIDVDTGAVTTDDGAKIGDSEARIKSLYGEDVQVEPLVPKGTQLDNRAGRHFISLVGFLFLDTHVLGVPAFFHRDFEEVNLRFYVWREVREERRRAVVFIRELVPLPLVAGAARL